MTWLTNNVTRVLFCPERKTSSSLVVSDDGKVVEKEDGKVVEKVDGKVVDCSIVALSKIMKKISDICWEHRHQRNIKWGCKKIDFFTMGILLIELI